MKETLTSFVKQFVQSVDAVRHASRITHLKAQVMDELLRQSGAERGFVLARHQGEWCIEVTGSARAASAAVAPVPVQGSGLIDATLFAQVLARQQARAGAAPSPSPGGTSAPGGPDAGRPSASVLCLPVLRQGQLSALFYLENADAAPDAAAHCAGLLQLSSHTMGAFLANALHTEQRISGLSEQAQLLGQLQARHQQTLEAVLAAQEDERSRIAERLHDGLGYLLSTLQLNLTSLAEAEPASSQQPFLATAQQLLQESFRKLRQVAGSLAPEPLAGQSLAAALSHLCQRLQLDTAVPVRFQCFREPAGQRLKGQREIYRLVQELLNNAVEHARARQVEVQLVYHPDQLILTVEDDGAGFDYEGQLRTGAGRGLRNVANRVAYLEGSLTYETAPGHGTSVMIQLPLVPLPEH